MLQLLAARLEGMRVFNVFPASLAVGRTFSMPQRWTKPPCLDTNSPALAFLIHLKVKKPGVNSQAARDSQRRTAAVDTHFFL